MEACVAFFLVVLGLAVIAVVGHFLWVAIVTAFKGTSHPPARAHPPRNDDAAQLEEIRTALRQIAALIQAGELPPEVGETVQRALDQRRLQMIEQLNRRPSRVRETRPAPASVASANVIPRRPPREEQIPAVIPVLELAEVPAVERVPEVPPEPVVPVAPPQPRRSFGEMMAGFMEERNILWGEVVGGLLIVGCSIALVISLRQTLEEIPYFPFLIIGAVTASLIGAGRYTLSHWKLEATSRGLLVIGTMLVPLSFMVLAGLAAGRERGWWEAGIEALVIALFTWLVRGAANVVVLQPIGPAAPRPDWLVTVAVLGASASLLLVPHIEAISDPSSGLIGLAGYLPALVFLVSQAFAWFAVYRGQGVSPRQAGGLFLGLGLSVYAVGVAFVFLVYRTANVGQALEYLAAPVALAGLPLLAGGTIASAKLRAPDTETAGLPHAAAAVIATMLSLGGTLVMLLALAAAWPHPIRLTAIGAIDCAVLALVAHRFRLAPAYIPAQVCLAVAVLTGYHTLAGHLDVDRAELGRQIITSWLSPTSGVVLLGLAGLLAAAAEWRARKQYVSDSLYLLSGAGLAALASIVLVAVDGKASPGRAAWVFGVCACGAWLVNVRWRLTWLTSVAAAFLFGALVFALRWCDAEMPLAETLTWSLLADAGLVLLLASGVGRVAVEERFLRSFILPLQHAALTASVGAALGIFAALRWDWLSGAAIAALGVSCVWLVLAWRQRQPVLFAAFQGALAVSVLFGCVRVLQTQPWFTRDLVGLVSQIQSWQVYGIGLSALSLTWVLARFRLRKHERAWTLLEPHWSALDRVLLSGLVVLAVVVTIVGIAPGLADELTPLADGVARPTADLYLCGPLGWCWLGVLALALGLTLWQGRARSALLGLTALALCCGVAAAAAFADSIAAASALRWSLAISFVALSALVWLRGRLVPVAPAAGIRWEQGGSLAALVRGLLIVGAVAPVLLLTAIVAGIGFAHQQPSGPLAGSLFADAGVVVNNLGPLLLLCVGLTGHGVRERHSGYAFAAGQVLLAAVVGGHALGIITGGAAIGSREVVQLGQLATGVTGAWLLGWLGVRRLGRLGRPAARGRGTMLVIQDALTCGSHCLWLLPALALLAFPNMFPTALEDAPFVEWEAGSWLGWAAVGLAVAAGFAYRLDALVAVPSWFVALAAGLVGGLSCCTLAIYAPTWDQRALMLVAAVLSLGFVWTLVRWSSQTPRTWLLTSTNSLAELAATTAVGIVAVILAVQRAATFEDWYWSATAAGVVAAAAVSAALLRRGEAWMFAGSLLAMLAASLVLCGACPIEATASWLVLLAQVNLATAGGVGVLWLSIRHIIGRPNAELHLPVWLCVHHGLTIFGNLALICLGGAIVACGGGIKGLACALAVGGIAGWVAATVAIVGAAWLVSAFARHQTLHTLAGGGLMVGVLAACTVTRWDLGVLWLGQHVLTLTWLLTTACVLIAAWLADLRRQTLGEQQRPWWTELVPVRASVEWVLGIGAAVALLAFVSGMTDPYRPYWPCAVVLAVSVLTGALAVWRQRGDLVFASGPLFNVAGFIAWWAWAETAAVVGADTALLYRFLFVQVNCLALASLVWNVIELVGNRHFHLAESPKGVPPFRYLAAWAAVGLLAITVGVTLAVDVSGRSGQPYDMFVWFALAASLAAAATLWDGPERRWAGPLPTIYALGLVTITVLLHQTGLPPEWLGWMAAVLLGPYALVASLVCWLALRRAKLPQSPPAPLQRKGWPLAWFVLAQAAVSGVALGLGVWMCLAFANLGPRLGGFWAVAFLPPAWALLVPAWQRLTAEKRFLFGYDVAFLADARLPRLAALLLGVVAAACLHVAFVPPDYAAPFLHRSVLLLAALTWMSALYGLWLPRLFPEDGGWGSLARRLATPLGIGACAMLLLVLLQEFAHFNPNSWTTPLVWPGVVVVAVALGVLIGGALTFALSPSRDLFKLSERRRTLYVYAAEVLLVLLLVHLRLNIPFIVPAYLWRHWVFGIMAVAFVGAGLSEMCQRRGLRVLAGPLQRTAMLLPIFPLAAFLLLPLGRQHGDVSWMADDYRWHAAIWFLMGGLYLIVALTRRSSRLALAAAVLANFGLWVLFGHHDQLTFIAHPQLWLIPVGLIVLAAERLNHERLQPAQALALRYAGLLLIYLSSTADMFITGLGQSAVLPIVLALLAVAGVLLGILLRVRAFLFLGVTFLFLVVFSQIWHAAVDRAQTWVWWASGIVLGVAILTLFALFEKRRNDVLKMVAEIKRWQ